MFDGLAEVFTGAFGQPVTVTPHGGAPRTISAMPVQRSVDPLDITMAQPAIHARSVDVSDLRDGDAVAIGGASYLARVFRPDGRGMTTVFLEAA